MDGFDGNSGVLVLAATNRADTLDPALLRPGRFDRHIHVGLPDVEGRRAILDVHVKDKPMQTAVDLGLVARRTIGFSGASLANLMNEAAIVAARKDKTEIGYGGSTTRLLSFFFLTGVASLGTRRSTTRSTASPSACRSRPAPPSRRGSGWSPATRPGTR